MKAGRPVPCVPSWGCARGPFAAMFGQKKKSHLEISGFQMRFLFGCRGDVGVARALCRRPGGRLVMVKE